MSRPPGKIPSPTRCRLTFDLLEGRCLLSGLLTSEALPDPVSAAGAVEAVEEGAQAPSALLRRQEGVSSSDEPISLGTEERWAEARETQARLSEQVGRLEDGPAPRELPSRVKSPQSPEPVEPAAGADNPIGKGSQTEEPTPPANSEAVASKEESAPAREPLAAAAPPATPAEVPSAAAKTLAREGLKREEEPTVSVSVPSQGENAFVPAADSGSAGEAVPSESTPVSEKVTLEKAARSVRSGSAARRLDGTVAGSLPGPSSERVAGVQSSPAQGNSPLGSKDNLAPYAWDRRVAQPQESPRSVQTQESPVVQADGSTADEGEVILAREDSEEAQEPEGFAPQASGLLTGLGSAQFPPLASVWREFSHTITQWGSAAAGSRTSVMIYSWAVGLASALVAGEIARRQLRRKADGTDVGSHRPGTWFHAWVTSAPRLP